MLKWFWCWLYPERQVFNIRFSNRAAVQDLQAAIEIADTLIESYPWDECIKELKEYLEDAWDGLTFRFQE